MNYGNTTEAENNRNATVNGNVLTGMSYLNHVVQGPIGQFANRIQHTILDDLEDNEIEQVEHFNYKQELQRKLTVTSIIGLGFTLMGVPFGLSSTLWISLIDGANVTILYGWIVVSFFSLCVVLSLSEIISKYPTSGGVYHFSAILSNERYSLICSWITGWFLLIGNISYTISIMFTGSQFILSLFGLKDAYYKEDMFFVLGVFFIILSLSAFINFKLSNHLEKINKMCILWSIGTVLLIDILLIFFARKTNSIKNILTNFDNSRSGWPDPMAFLVGLQSSSFTLTGYGMLFSMTDEVKNPERNMAKGALSATSIASLTGIIFILPLLTILPELTFILDDNPEIMPIELVFKLSTESYLVSFLLALLLIVTVLFQSIGSLTTASRATYAFARDGGLPFNKYWIEIDSVEDSKLPKNALFLATIICGVLSLLSLLSPSAFSAFVGSSVISLALSNGIPILCLILNKRRKIKGAAFRLRRFGWLVNLLSIFWVILLFMIHCLPPAIKNLTWSTMNYSLFFIVLIIIFVMIGYKLWGKSSFEGPKIDHEYFELQNENHINQEIDIGSDFDDSMIPEDQADDDNISIDNITNFKESNLNKKRNQSLDINVNVIFNSESPKDLS